MKNFLIVLSILFFVIESDAQQSPGKNHAKLHINCVSCHTCGLPTKDDPCWVACPREKMITVYLKPEQTDELVVIDQGSERYGPVYFSHKIHAQMSGMVGGCGNCHHYNTLEQILKCSSCHASSRQRENIGIPDLKAAYHRQCMDCHREWSHETGCTTCHAPINNLKVSEKTVLEKQLKGKDHPPVTEPTKIVYETDFEPGKLVTFYHDDHVNNFKIKCNKCHAQESCTRCHDVNNVSSDKLLLVKEKKSLEEHHKKCFTCHKENDCTKCHLDRPLEPFNHKQRTGWALNKPHSNLPCVSCHGSKQPYQILDNQCTSCHKGWKKETFKHSVTGLRLDEIHSELVCVDCHVGNDYSVKPDCKSCHENFAYPKQKPGKLVSK
ncbi:MAG: cytochrome c3 family protein [Ignavibacteriales bacterium]|nr:cytochrome c3 family protein [Ignavibacteriales bacterium]